MKSSIRLGLPLFALAALASCATFQVPKDYLPDSKLVYLTQNTGFEPIAYKPAAADPYSFQADLAGVDPKNPGFLRTANWNTLLKADFKADSRLYREVEAHFNYILNLPDIKDLRAVLDAANIQPTPALAPDKGEKLKDYSNGAVFRYPGADNAQITILDGGYYEIVFGDKSIFRYQSNGSYERLGTKGQILFATYPQQSQIITSQDGFIFGLDPDFRRVEGPQGKLVYTDRPVPQYQFTPPNDAAAPTYFLFVDGQKRVKSLSLSLKNGLRIDWFPQQAGTQETGVLIINGDQAVAIDRKFIKSHKRFDTKARTTTELLSLFLPEGIRLTNFVAADPAYGQVNPAWPEGYKTKAMGPFDLLYLAKDEALVQRLKADRLTAIADTGRKLTGLSATQRRALVIPPDLETYRKLMVSQPGELINWYPSGFETKDIIVMWPVSVPRYSNANGQDYFFDKEFYEILTHEYVHVLVGENTGLLNPVPVWLNEGLAVWVETTFSPEVKHYWDLTFQVSQGLKRLLDWDLVTTTSTGDLEIAKARVHYAQSYALVRALMQKFGAAKLGEYTKSFRTKTIGLEAPDLKSSYRTKFKAVFGMEFSEAIKLLEPPAKGKAQ